MTRSIIAALLGLTLAAPATAQPSIATAAHRAAHAAAQSAPRTEIPPAYRWTAVGLLLAGAASLTTAILLGDDCGGNVFIADCDATRGALIVTGSMFAGAGGVVAVIGHTKRRPASPSIAIRVRF